MTAFIQGDTGRSSLDCWSEMLSDGSPSMIAAFAYVTDSGAAQMEYIKSLFQGIRACRWIFGIDYGRSHPTAIRRMERLVRNSEVRIFDGSYVLNANGFAPRRSFHLKTVVTQDQSGSPSKQLVGSGNLSRLGLTNGIEAGCLVDYASGLATCGEEIIAALDLLWDESVAVGEIIDQYSERWAAASLPVVSPVATPAAGVRKFFWVDVGYVTKNRGEHRPGNQFDLPKGAHVHLGLQQVQNPMLNSVLGKLNMRTPAGDVVSRNLRYGNNAMEKLTLPIPEDYGYGAYDGRILTFEKVGEVWVLECFEHDDFERIYRRNIDWFDRMQSGRLFGTISI